MATLQNLLDSLDVSVENEPLIDVQGLSLDTRTVKKGDLFFAYPGVSFDRREFIPQVIQAGASAVLKESDDPLKEGVSWVGDVPIIPCRDVSSKIGYLSEQFYDYPSREMRLVGITGTSGKTSCSHLLSQALELLGQRAGVMGSIGCGPLDHIEHDTTLTSPDPISVNALLRNLLDQGVYTVTMETTSHALHQGRFNGVEIGMGIFTNLGRDHFDYHKDRESYMAAKRKLFEKGSLQNGIFNCDDPVGLQWLYEFRNDFMVVGFSLNPEIKISGLPIVTARDIHLSEKGLSAFAVTPWGEGKIQAPLLGRFNVSNLLVVISALSLMGYPFKDILQVLPHLKSVLGRMQTLGGGDKPLVVIDNSHKPEALQDVLVTLRGICKGDLISVFGCGGNRDRGKRPIMGGIAKEFADKVMVTSDNLRFEKPEDIIPDILAGMPDQNNVDVEPDRGLAIEKVLRYAKAGDIVLLSGKGHEPYQIIGDECVPFSEAEVVKRCLNL